MATYIPGIESYTPEYTAFEPDFKFAQAVLSTRQDRYDTNYKQLNDLYGSVIYADMSREDTKAQRDQFADKLVPSINKIADMDLSIGRNVDAAKGVFNPFIENKLIQQDIYRTAKYKGELGRAQSLLDAPNLKASQQYWQTGIDYMNYQMDDFINASPEEAMNKPMPKYVPNANLYDMALDYLKESGIEAEDFYFTKDKKFIIKQTNGSLIYDASYDRVKRALATNGKVQQAYAADSYVQARRHAEKGVEAGLYSTINQGRVAWAENTISDITFKANELQLQFEGKSKELDELRQKHENRIKEVGEENLTQIEKDSYLDVMTERQEVEEQATANSELVEKMGQLTTDEESLLNRAYGSLMNWNISDDLRAAAKSYSMQGAKRVPMVNEFQRDIERHKLNMIRDAQNNAFKAEQGRLDRLNELKAAGVYVDPAIKNALDNFSGGLSGNVAFNTDADGNPNADTDIYAQKNSELKDAQRKVSNDQIETLLYFHQKDQASLGMNGKPESITIPGPNGDKVYTINEAREILRKPENQAFLNSKYETIANNFATEEDRKKYAPGISTRDALAIKNQINTTSGLATRIVNAEKEFNKRASENYAKLLNFKNTTGVPEIIEDIEKYGAPSIIKDGKVLSEDDYVKIALEKAKKRQFTDKVRIDEDFYSSWTVTAAPSLPGGSISAPMLIPTGPKFDEAKATKAAKKAYSNQYNAVNRTLNGFYNYDQSRAGDNPADVEPGYQAYGIHTLMRGGSTNLMTDETAFMSNTYTTGLVSPKTLANMPGEQRIVLSDFISQLNTGGVQFLAGDVKSIDEDDLNDRIEATGGKAQQMINQSMMDLSSGIASGDKKGLFTVTYIDAYGAQGGDQSQGAYVIRFDQTAMDKSIGLVGDNAPGTGIIGKQEKELYSTVTVLVNSDQDISGYGQSQYTYNTVDTDIDFTGSYYRNIPEAGSFKIWKDGDSYITSIEEEIYAPDNPKAVNGFVKNSLGTTKVVYPQSYGQRAGQPVTRADIQQVADYMQNVRLMETFEANQTLINKRTKK
jgi:hypothetical protein